MSSFHTWNTAFIRADAEVGRTAMLVLIALLSLFAPMRIPRAQTSSTARRRSEEAHVEEIISQGPRDNWYPERDWKQVVEVKQADLTVNVYLVTQRELVAEMKKAGAVRDSFTSGAFTIMHGLRVGAKTCSIFMTSVMDRSTLWHEMRHCYGWIHP
jgi:hypothetical protein